MVVKAQYICYVQVDNNWYWNQQTKQHVITATKCTMLNTQLEVNAVTYFHAIPKSVCTRKQAKNTISRQSICLTDSDYDYILEEIGHRDRIEFERNVEVYSDDKEN